MSDYEEEIQGLLDASPPDVDLEYVDGIYGLLEAMDVELDPDPLELGPQRLQTKIAEVRSMRSRLEKIFLQIAHDLAKTKRFLGYADPILELRIQELLATDIEVRSGPSIADRRALAMGRCRKIVAEVDRLKRAVSEYESALVVIRSKKADLGDIRGRLNDQMKLCQEQLTLGERWGSRAPKGVKKQSLKPGLGASTDAEDDLDDLLDELGQSPDHLPPLDEEADAEDDVDLSGGDEEPEEEPETPTEPEPEEEPEIQAGDVVLVKDVGSVPDGTYVLGEDEVTLADIHDLAGTDAPAEPEPALPLEPDGEEDLGALLAALPKKPKKAPKKKKKTHDFEALPLNGLVCEVCGSPQRTSPHGDLCVNGHGGAPGVTKEEWDAAQKPADPKDDLEEPHQVDLPKGAIPSAQDILPATSPEDEVEAMLLGLAGTLSATPQQRSNFDPSLDIDLDSVLDAFD